VADLKFDVVVMLVKFIKSNEVWSKAVHAMRRICKPLALTPVILGQKYPTDLLRYILIKHNVLPRN